MEPGAEPLIKDVSDTAFMVAAFRAIESERPDALFHDPLAGRLAGERGRRIVKDVSSVFLGGWTAVIRTCIIDDFIRSAVSQGADTVLNLGAGLDTRPYRMELPETLRWIEADYPHLIDFKESRLREEKPRCRLERVRLDLSDAGARRSVFARIGSQSERTLVLTEGVIPYLSAPQAAALAQDLRGQSAFRWWVVDYFSRAATRYRQGAAMKRKMANAPFLFEPEDYFGFFMEHGWIAGELRYIWEEAERLQRPLRLPFPASLLVRLRALFLSKSRREEFRKFAAYVRLEPAPR